MDSTLVVKALGPRRSHGRKSSSVLPGTPAVLNFAGVMWTSPVPRSNEEADFFNAACERINQQANKQI